MLDAGGRMVAARGTDYVRSVAATAEAGGTCTAIGQPRAFSAGDAALVSGTAIHGEDFDDTYEGTPVHVGAVMVPAVLAAAEAWGRPGADALKGIACGGELICRMALVAPGAIHRAGFHPTSVIGALGAAAGVAAALGLGAREMVSALGIAGSLASGIIEYLAEGASTKRLHPGWAAQAGLRAARLARAGFAGPRTVLDGTHGFYRAFADGSVPADLTKITAGLGAQWRIADLAFKPYACGTMIQPFIDCAIRLRRSLPELARIERIEAAVAEGTVHRLWEPKGEKAAPSSPYSAKFSGPYGIAVGLLDGAAGLGQFSAERVRDPALRALAGKVAYRIDAQNDYPRNYSGELRIATSDGQSFEARQPFLRGGGRAPLDDDELIAKFRANAMAAGPSISPRNFCLSPARSLRSGICPGSRGFAARVRTLTRWSGECPICPPPRRSPTSGCST